MPVNRGRDTKGTFYRWGKTGKKYYYKTGDKASRDGAKSKANRQAKAIYASGYRTPDSEKPSSVKIKRSTRKGKKLQAIFYNSDGKKLKTIHFGAAGMSDYTKHKDDDRKNRYLKRHRSNEKWNKPMTAGSLSRWILWGEKTLNASKSSYARRFKLRLL